MTDLSNLIFVDVEATGISPFSGVMTEFGAVHYNTRETFHGVIHDSKPSEENPAKPVLIPNRAPHDASMVMTDFDEWIRGITTGRPIFVSDNPAYDFQWINYYFDVHLGRNPLGHSGRRISDFWAGLQGDFTLTQGWKKFRVTPHDHDPVHDSLGNVEAFETIMKMTESRK
jgi:hypothetical protein